MFELRETGDWDIFLGPPERARAETGGADQWVLKRREYSGFARVNKVTSASLGYPLSVSNKNSTLKANFAARVFPKLLREQEHGTICSLPEWSVVGTGNRNREHGGHGRV